MSSMTPDKRALLKQMLQKKGIAPKHQTSIPRRKPNDVCVASFLQEGLWFLDQLDPGKATYNVPGATRITGGLNKPALEQALTEILRRHEILRTTFRILEGRPIQDISPPSVFVLDTIDLSELDSERREAEMLRLATEEARNPFDLENGPLFRAFLIKLAETENVLVLNIHHIVTDGWSMGVFTRELFALYEAYVGNRPSPLSELPIQFADFAIWQRQRLRGEHLENQLSFWRHILEEPLPVLNLPADKTRPAFQSCNGNHETLALPAKLADGLRILARREDTTLFELMLGAFKVLLNHYTGDEDIIIGTPVANRHLKELEPLIGYFVNMIPLRTGLDGDPPFSELVDRVRKVTMNAYAHQELPFGKLVEELALARDTSRNPVFQVEFILLTQEHAPAVYGYGFRSPIKDMMKLGPLQLAPVEVESGVAKFDLVVLLWETADTISGTFEYNADLFYPSTVQGMINEYIKLLNAVVATPDARLSSLKRGLRPKERTNPAVIKSRRNQNFQKLKAVRRKAAGAIKREE